MDQNYLIKHPKDQLFYRVLALIMGAWALNTQYWSWFSLPENKVYRLHRMFMYIMAPVAIVSQVLYFVVNYSVLEFETLAMVYTITLIALVILLKFVLSQTKSYKTVMEDFMTKIHLHNCYESCQETYVVKALIAAEKYSRLSCFYYMILCYVCYASCLTFPIIRNLQKIESYDNITFRLEIIIHMWLPFDYEFNFRNWVLVQISMVYVGFVAVTYIYTFDTINLAVIYHLLGHIAIFKDRIKIKFADKTLSDQEVKNNLIEASQYYTFITQSLKTIEATFGLNVSSIYIHNLLSGGLFIYQFMTSGKDTGTILSYGSMIPIYMGMLIIISFALEKIRILAEDISDLIYDTNWENMSLINQKLVLMLLIQVQPTLEFNAAFNIKTGVQPALTILKTTFSYYVMIKSRM